MKTIKYWLFQRSLGLIILAFVFCMVFVATMTNYSDAPLFEWIAYGAFALIVFNASLCVFRCNILPKIQFEKDQEKEG